MTLTAADGLYIILIATLVYIIMDSIQDMLNGIK